jgi:hypothetical protein
MLYSQINYLGCFLPLPEKILNDLSALIEKLAGGKLNVGKCRFYRPVSMGGLGLFELGTYLDAQRCAWIKRAYHLDDLWKLIVFLNCGGVIQNAKCKFFDPKISPCLSCIASSFERFTCMFTMVNGNFNYAIMFENTALTTSLREKTVMTKNFFEENFYNMNRLKLMKLRVDDFMSGETFLSFERFTVRNNLAIDQLTFLRCKRIINTARIKYGNNIREGTTGTDIVTFLHRSKKGSGRLRKVLCSENFAYIPHNIVKFASNMEFLAGEENAKKINSVWYRNIFSNSTKTFLFKLHNNTLGYNNSVAHFIRGHSANCTFCDKVGNNEIEPETPSHLFFTCLQVENFMNTSFRWFTSDNLFEVSRKELFCYFSRVTLSDADNETLTIFSKLLLKFIWDSKQRFCLPVVDYLKITIKIELERFIGTNKAFKNTILSSNFFPLNQ